MTGSFTLVICVIRNARRPLFRPRQVALPGCNSAPYSARAPAGHSSREKELGGPRALQKDRAERSPLRLTYACFCAFRALRVFLCTSGSWSYKMRCKFHLRTRVFLLCKRASLFALQPPGRGHTQEKVSRPA